MISSLFRWGLFVVLCYNGVLREHSAGHKLAAADKNYFRAAGGNARRLEYWINGFKAPVHLILDTERQFMISLIFSNHFLFKAFNRENTQYSIIPVFHLYELEISRTLR